MFQSTFGQVGANNLIEVAQLAGMAGALYERVLHAAPSVGILLPRDKLQRDAGGELWLEAEEMPIERTRHSDQRAMKLARPATFFCVGHELLIGAAHAFPDPTSTGWLVAFDVRHDQWRPDPAPYGRYLIRPSQLVAITGAEAWIKSPRLGDAVLVSCQRESSQTRMPAPLRLASATTVPAQGRLAMLGYPRGLPHKAVVPFPRRPRSAPRARLLDGPVLRSTLDSFQGNSGGPVFNEYGEVVAIHNGGEPDMRADGRISIQREGTPASRATAIDVLALMLAGCGVAVRAGPDGRSVY